MIPELLDVVSFEPRPKPHINDDRASCVEWGYHCVGHDRSGCGFASLRSKRSIDEISEYPGSQVDGAKQPEYLSPTTSEEVPASPNGTDEGSSLENNNRWNVAENDGTKEVPDVAGDVLQDWCSYRKSETSENPTADT
jgi:hypothetical protein